MSKKKQPQTKAIAFTTGEAQGLKSFDGEIIKESFSEHKYKKETTVTPNGVLGFSTTQETIVVGEQNVFALFFEDGSIYEIGKGFRNQNQYPLEETKDWVNEALKSAE